MKSTLSFLAFLLVVSISISAQKGVTNNESFDLQSFDRVEASMGVNVTVSEEKAEKLEVKITNGIASDVVYEIKGRTLFVKMKNKIGQGVIVNVTVSYKTLVALTASMGATIDNIGTLYANQLELTVSSDASMNLKVDAKSIKASAVAGSITLEGDVQYQEILANTGGKYLASELESKQALAKSNTGATIEINVTEKVESKASFGSTIEISGNPPSSKWEENMGGKVSPH